MNDLKLLLGRVFAALAQAGVLVLLTRTTPVDEFGSFGTAIASGAVAMGILGLGVPMRALLSGHQDERDARSVAWIAAVIISLLLVPVVLFFGILAFSEVSPAIIAGAIFSGGEFAGNVCQNLLFGRREMRRAEIFLIARRVLPLVAVTVAVVCTQGTSSPTVYGALMLGTAFAWIFGFVVCYEVTPRWRLVGRELRVSRTYWLANMGSMAQQLDVVIVGGVAGAAPAAGFAAGFRLASPVHIVTGLVVARLGPELRAVGGGQTARRYSRIGTGYSLLVIMSSPALALGAAWILGGDYGQFYWVFVALFANSGLSVANQILTVTLFARKPQTWSVVMVTLLSTCIGLLVVLVGALSSLIWLAALGTVTIQIVLLLGLIFVGRVRN